ncbi:class I SAM-dependent DNA methyltransferase [Frankia sp. CNm7]|uniref:site-specific DNA-methyltransferase (adenine-specific) n=1 Tax=Frankia nepalensis TaxID=1836974 RepID=A0A937RPT4_9ACTN|nr:hypothetical protein [Frankia nepalensis]MBL7502027.1 class I SAM-dependent DNA methyltransferase [Frankia nepalensis]MBL7510297.1 class I SAM-dependent DNA methyltransferase [Frankia nepalensis]MBL7517033.1 class I SAM-dependent DNA methyltransferase [Frankia nepalensis]MBL7630428.1 hypothetical protein [Frankia nepalensis]
MSFDALTNRGEYLSPYFIDEVLPGEIRKSVAARWAEREKAAAVPAVTTTLVEPPADPGYGAPAAGVEATTALTPTGGGTVAVAEPAATLRLLVLAGGGGEAAEVPEETLAVAVTPRAGLRGLRSAYYDRKSDLVALGGDSDDAERARQLHWLHEQILAGLSFPPKRHVRTVVHAGVEVAVPLAAAVDGVWAVECGWATEIDAAVDAAGAGRLLDPVDLGPRERVTHGMRLVSHLFAADEPPRFVLLLAGAVIILADRRTWGEARFLAANLDVAFGRNDTKPGGELEVIAALFGADALCPPEAGGAEPLAELIAGSQKQAVGVTAELRNGLRESVELIANEILARLAEAGVRPEQIDDLASLGTRLTQESLRYLYRILVLLYAEARPELHVLPVDHPEYVDGYSLARLGDLVARRLPPSPASRNGTHLFDSLDLLFRVVNDGYRAHGTTPPDSQTPAGTDAAVPEGGPASDEAVTEKAKADTEARRRAGRAAPKVSEGEGIRFEPLRSDLFAPDAITLIGQSLPWPDDEDEDGADGPQRTIDTRLRNAVLYRVLRRLMITKGGRKIKGGGRRRAGFISYAQLGINQLGAVYEGLMSYSGFIAGEDLYEVAKGGDPKDGSWMVPASKAHAYEDDDVFVREIDDDGHRTEQRRRYPAGSFVYRLSGRDRQTSASYYTPQSLTEVTVQLALKYRIEEAGPDFKARDMLDWTICEPALGSGAFLNEAINQVAAEYLRRRQEEKQKEGTLDNLLDPESYAVELQKVKAYIALHNSYGVDLNATAIELADVSLWLNVMHAGLQAPWFGLHLRRGNSLVGAGRRYYLPATLADRSWLNSAPVDHPFRDGELPAGAIHHFLLPAAGWGAVAAEKEAKELAPDDAKKLATWRRAITKAPTTKGTKSKPSQADQLAALARRVEYLWSLVQQRLEISEREIRRQIDVWGADDLPEVRELVSRQKIKDDLEAPGTPYWRLKKLMDAWCALWFWPVDGAGLLDGTGLDYGRAPLTVTSVVPEPAAERLRAADDDATRVVTWEELSIFGEETGLALAAPAAANGRSTLSSGKSAKRPERSRGAVPLASLDHWIRFATALIGRGDVAQDSLISQFTSLDALEDHEDGLAAWMGQEDWTRLPELFPWLETVDQIAKRQGFFHWEVEFGQVFQHGGFDLQVGNPPWFRPRWDEGVILGEYDPWFTLHEQPPVEVWNSRKKEWISAPSSRAYLLSELASNAGLVASLGSGATYDLLSGSQPNLYRAFMVQVFRHAHRQGTGGLIHPDTHFSGTQEARLRAAAYGHLRLHAHFHNRLLIFSDINWNTEFGVHIYGGIREPSFGHVNWLCDPATLAASIDHDGTGGTPGMKRFGTWDLRPHRRRLIDVNMKTLAEWNGLIGDKADDPQQARLLFPLSSDEQNAIESLSSWRHRVGDDVLWMSRGYNESGAKKAGLIRAETRSSADWREVIIRGPQFAISTPIAKQPPETKHTDKPVGLVRLSGNYIPATDYVPACQPDRFVAAQDVWNDKPFSDYFRLFWRSMIATNTERSLFAAILPPGPSHVDAVHSLAAPSNQMTVLVAGFWSALPLDYVLRIAGRAHLHVTEARAMPNGSLDHPLASALIFRTLRLNCLTTSYAPLWTELYDANCVDRDGWAVAWPQLEPLTDVGPEWGRETPLRAEYARRAALVEIDALVSVWLGISIDALVAIYRSRFPQLVDYDAQTWFDANGRKIAANFNTYGHGQTKEDFIELQEHLERPTHKLPPAGYAAPFYKADREAEMRAAHAVFSARLQAAREAGWRESEDPVSLEAVG